MRLTGRLLLIAAFLMTVPAWVSEVRAEDARVKGTIRNVDLATGDVAIVKRNDRVIVLHTDERTEITRNGEPARLDDLRPGDRAEAGYDRETLLASAIVARGENASREARVEGVIENVDTAASTLTIQPRDGRAVTLRVTPNTEITLDGRPARLDDLARGFLAGALYNTNTFEALRVAAEGLAEIRGTVRDVGQDTLTIASGDRVLTLHIAPFTTITLNGRPAALADLRRGYQVVASYFPSSLVAARVNAESLAEVGGHILAIEGTTLYIAPLVEGEVVHLFISHTTEITINGEPATFERLEVGMAVRAVYDIASFIALRINAQGRDGGDCNLTSVAGSIARVDNTGIAVNPTEGTAPVILLVDERTQITINGEPARLSDLQVGMRVEARYCRNNSVATVIAARRARSSR